jgi:hypothetical protein
MKLGTTSGLPDGTDCIFKRPGRRYVNVAVQLWSYKILVYDFMKITGYRQNLIGQVMA